MPISNFPRLRYSDVEEIAVLGTAASPVAIAALASGGVADVVTAEGTASCQTSSLNIQGCKQLDIFIDITTNPAAASKLFVKVRFSGKESPDTAVVRDWGYIQIDDIDAATGVSTVMEYLVEIDLDAVNGVAGPAGAERRYCLRIQQISGRHASAIVWTDVVGVAGVEGVVYFMRQGGGM